MKILHVVRQFYPCIGGIENFVHGLAKEQVKRGNVVKVLTLNRSFLDGKTLPDEEAVDGIMIKRIPYIGSKRYPIALSCIRYLDGFDIVNIHCVDFFVDYLVLLKPFHKKKIVLHTHGGFFHTDWLARVKKVYFNIITRMVLRGCDRIIACSNSDYELFSGISRNIIRIDNGVDIDRYAKVKKNIENGTLLYIGRIDENKRIDNLIKVAAYLKMAGQKVRLRIVGADWRSLKPKFLALMGKMGIENEVTFLGQLSDEALLRELSKAHLFVSASEYEGFGISVIEAMASGTICVLNSIPSFKEFMVDSQNGFIADYDGTEGAALVIKKALAMPPDDYYAMAEKAKEFVSRYSWGKVAVKISRVYKEVLLKN